MALVLNSVLLPFIPSHILAHHRVCHIVPLRALHWNRGDTGHGHSQVAWRNRNLSLPTQDRSALLLGLGPPLLFPWGTGPTGSFVLRAGSGWQIASRLPPASTRKPELRTGPLSPRNQTLHTKISSPLYFALSSRGRNTTNYYLNKLSCQGHIRLHFLPPSIPLGNPG